MKVDIKCPDCQHDIDNHSYKGCLVKGCKCKVLPSQICQLFEPELEPMEKLAIELKDCMYRGEPKPESHSVQRRKAAQQGKPAPDFSKPDEGRLLTEELVQIYCDRLVSKDPIILNDELKLILEDFYAKTASIKDAECQERVERIFKIIDYIKAVENFPLVEGQLESMVILHFDIPDEEAKKIVQALRKKELKDALQNKTTE